MSTLTSSGAKSCWTHHPWGHCHLLSCEPIAHKGTVVYSLEAAPSTAWYRYIKWCHPILLPRAHGYVILKSMIKHSTISVLCSPGYLSNRVYSVSRCETGNSKAVKKMAWPITTCNSKWCSAVIHPYPFYYEQTTTDFMPFIWLGKVKTLTTCFFTENMCWKNILNLSTSLMVWSKLQSALSRKFDVVSWTIE